MEKLSDLYYQIPLKPRLIDRDEELGHAPRSYKELRAKLFSVLNVSKESKIEYMDDFGEFQIIDNDQRYSDALRCSMVKFTIYIDRKKCALFIMGYNILLLLIKGLKYEFAIDVIIQLIQKKC